jgi:hypothetical protein
MRMSETEAATAITKLQALSEARANKVFSLIEDLAELEALENAEDLKDARDALAEMKAEAGLSPTPNAVTGNKTQFANIFEGAAPAVPGPTIPYSQLRRDLGLDH